MPSANDLTIAALAVGIITLIITGQLVPGRTHDREIRRADAYDLKLDKLADAMHELATATKALAERREP